MWTLLLEYDCICSALLSSFTLFLIYRVPPYHQAFQANDASIQKPVYPLSISCRQLLCYVVFPPLVFLYAIEFMVRDKPQENCAKKYFFGVNMCAALVYFAKVTVGKIRPHFLTAIRMEPRKVEAEYGAGYIEEITLPAAVPAWRRREIYMSFFSGHAMAGVYSAVYLILYLESKFGHKKNLYLAFIEFALFLLGLYPGITQGRNYWHHWLDVAIGHIVGAIMAYVSYHLIL